MITIDEIRKKYPDYNDLTDKQLVDSLHDKHYQDMPKDEFYSKINFNEKSSNPSVMQDIYNIPNKLKEIAPKILPELEAFGGQPLSRKLKNTAAGTLELANVPHDIYSYALSRGLINPNEASEAPVFLKNKVLDTSKLLGLGEQQPGDIAGQLLTPSLALKAPAKALGRAAINETKNLPERISQGLEVAKNLPENIGKGLNKAGDIAPIINHIATAPYRRKEEYLTEHNLHNNVRVNPENLDEAEKIIRSRGIRIDNKPIPAKAVDEAFDRARKGDHRAIFGIQSTLRTIGRQLSSTGGIHNDFGQRVHSTAENLLNDVHEHFRDIGHPKAAELGEQATRRNSTYHKISPYIRLAGTAGVAAASLPTWAKHLTKITPS